VQPGTPGANVSPQTPSVAPVAFVHAPPQHSKSVEQTSPVCVQNEPRLLQMPPLQNPPQQSPFWAHGLPAVLHAVLSGAQTPPPVPFGTHCPPQQSLDVPHDPLSATHAVAPQTLLTHDPRQHSLPVVHAIPATLQLIGLPQIFPPSPPIAVQFAEQHWVLFAQLVPLATHVPASPRLPSTIASMKVDSSIASADAPSVVVTSSGGFATASSEASLPPSVDPSGSLSLPHPAHALTSIAVVAKSASAAEGNFFMEILRTE